MKICFLAQVDDVGWIPFPGSATKSLYNKTFSFQTSIFNKSVKVVEIQYGENCIEEDIERK